ncbi:MAG: short-chain dehydrogenase [Candidatus Binatia bacterium]|nr:MAG: short-chain dehydrogenase [Candidatus Binatia bacterium]
MAWSRDDVPDLSGRTVVVTGANSGIGFEAARVFAQKGARVVLACRDAKKAEEARARIVGESPGATVEVELLDLANLASVRDFARRFSARSDRLDVLCNNAGVMALPLLRTADGFEMQFGTNHLGHFALTGLLLPALLSTPSARVVTVSSNAHRFGRMDFENWNAQRSYGKWRAYAQSKLANLLFAFELDRRLRACGADVRSVACHPGWAATNLQFVGPRLSGARLMESLARVGNRYFAQSAAMGALPILYAATASDVEGGDYIGPDGMLENRGYPRKVRPSRRALDPVTARRLWELSEDLTGVRYEFPASAGAAAAV